MQLYTDDWKKTQKLELKYIKQHYNIHGINTYKLQIMLSRISSSIAVVDSDDGCLYVVNDFSKYPCRSYFDFFSQDILPCPDPRFQSSLFWIAVKYNGCPWRIYRQAE